LEEIFLSMEQLDRDKVDFGPSIDALWKQILQEGLWKQPIENSDILSRGPLLPEFSDLL
jgi:hypothetical protein